MSLKVACLLFNGVADLDFVGPKDVFFASKWLGQENDTVFTVAATDAPVTCLSGMRVIPDYSFATAPQPNILVVPGAANLSAQLVDLQLLDWVQEISKKCLWVTGVCSGAEILIAAGPARGKRVTSHWEAFARIRKKSEAILVEGVRYVRDGQLVTSVGVSAGIDMALWVVGQLYGPDHARKVQHLLDYYPAPPYAAET